MGGQHERKRNSYAYQKAFGRNSIVPKRDDILMIIWSVLFGGCFASLVMIAFFGDRVLNALCRG
jgi:hypothetical protein